MLVDAEDVGLRRGLRSIARTGLALNVSSPYAGVKRRSDSSSPFRVLVWTFSLVKSPWTCPVCWGKGK